MPDKKTPRSAAEAEAMARRFERAKSLLSEGYEFTKDPDSNVVGVKKPGPHTSVDYWINMITDGCDCPDAMKGNYCKHEMCWDGIKAEADKTASLFAEDVALMEAAMCEQFDRENDGPEFPEYDQTRILLLAELRKAERGLRETEKFSTQWEAWETRLKKCEDALKLHDEVETKIKVDFYKRGLDKHKARA